MTGDFMADLVAAYPAARRVALAMLVSPDDVVQEACARLIRRNAQQPINDVGPYLNTTVRNLVREQWRKGQKEIPTEHLPEPEPVNDDALDERIEAMLDALGTLPVPDRRLLAKRYGYGLSVRFLADDHGIDENAMSQRLRRARHRLANRMKEQQP